MSKRNTSARHTKPPREGDRREESPQEANEQHTDLGPKPGAEQDGGESILSGRSREKHPAVPEEAELPPPSGNEAPRKP